MSDEERDPEALGPQIEHPAADLTPEDESDPGSPEAEPTFDVTTGEDLVESLPSGSEVPSEVSEAFWGAVVLTKIALISLSLAAMIAYFRGELLLAAGLAVVGVLAGARTVHRVRSFQGS